MGPRGTRHFLSATASGYVVLLTSALVGIVALPIGIRSYGLAAYGVWIAATSLSQYATGGALGMPLAVLTAVSATPSRTEAARIAAQGIRIVLVGIAALGAIGSALWLAMPSWLEALYGELGTTPDVVFAVGVLLIGTLLLQPLQVFSTVLAGRHRIVARDAYEASHVLGRFASLLLAVSIDQRLATLAAITVGIELAIAAIRVGHVTFVERIPVHRYLFDRSAPRPGLLGSGARFFVLQVQVAVIRNTDNLIISAVLGAAAVSVYAAPFRLVSAASSLIGAVQGPLWPAYGAARRRGDWDWIRTAHQRVIALGLTLGGALWIGVVGFAAPVISIWLGPAFPVDPYLLLVLGAYGFVATWVNANAILLNALDATRSQVVSGGAEAAVNVTTSILLAPVLGLAGVAGGTLLGATSVSSWFLPLDVRKQTEGRLAPRLTDLVRASAYTVPLVAATHAAVAHTTVLSRYVIATGAIIVQLSFAVWQFRGEIRQLFRRDEST